MAKPERTDDRIYFFLNYAHPAPSADYPSPEPDASVQTFFKALSKAVAGLLRPLGLDTGAQVGYYDQSGAPVVDARDAQSAALNTAEVLVTLYSPTYFARSWPQREHESFLDRLRRSGADPDCHVLPVLWLPIPEWTSVSGEAEAIARAKEIGIGVPDYLENGMRALCMLSLYKEPRQAMVNRLAERIVDCAVNNPIGSPLDDTDPPPVAADPVADARFFVGVVAPSLDNAPVRGAGDHYGSESVSWRPFAQQSASAADYAASVVERLLDSTARVDDMTTARAVTASLPTVVLIDPWILETDGGAAALSAACSGLPSWVLPMLLFDRDDPRAASRSEILADKAADLLSKVGVPDVPRVGRVKEFVNLIPQLISQARHRYLKYAPVYVPPGISVRPRLGADVQTPPRTGNTDE